MCGPLTERSPRVEERCERSHVEIVQLRRRLTGFVERRRRIRMILVEERAFSVGLQAREKAEK